jgi:hypothetical protein
LIGLLNLKTLKKLLLRSFGSFRGLSGSKETDSRLKWIVTAQIWNSFGRIHNQTSQQSSKGNKLLNLSLSIQYLYI